MGPQVSKTGIERESRSQLRRLLLIADVELNRKGGQEDKREGKGRGGEGEGGRKGKGRGGKGEKRAREREGRKEWRKRREKKKN